MFYIAKFPKKMSRFSLVCFRGKYAVVKRCVRKDTGKIYAAKFIKKRRRGKCCRSDILHEVAILDLALANPWIVHMREVYETQHDVIVVME